MLIRKEEIVELSQGIRRAIDGQNFDPRDNKEGVMSILKNDIYTLIHIEKEQRNSAQIERDHLSEYLSDISHQLKTPITSMLLMANLLEDAPEDKQKEFIFNIKKELAHMEWLISVLLKIAKLDSGVIEWNMTDINIHELISHSMRSLEIMLDIKDQKIEVNHDITIHCDKRWTIEALTNLLKNASECSREGTTIYVDSGENPIYKWISITDTGEGIPRERLAGLFRRFENSQNENGYGIGLPLALAIVRGQNGDIEVSPGGNGVGATFTVKFFKS